jgi:hypothetical protein
LKLPEPYTFFVDRALGGKVIVGALRAAKYQAEAHDEHFDVNTPDADWLPVVGQKGWVLLTKDKAIRANELERRALLSNNVAAFMLGKGDIPGAEMAKVFINSMRTMQRALRRFDVPIIATVNRGGGVSVLWAEGEQLRPPKALNAPKPRPT